MSKAWTHPASTKDYVVKHLKVNLMDISLIKKKVEHFYIWLRVICISFWLKCLLLSLVHLPIGFCASQFLKAFYFGLLTLWYKLQVFYSVCHLIYLLMVFIFDIQLKMWVLYTSFPPSFAFSTDIIVLFSYNYFFYDN